MIFENFSFRSFFLKNRTDLIKEFKWQTLEKFLKGFSTIFMSFLIARISGPEDFGKYSYAIALTNIFIVVSDLGVHNLIVAQISKYTKNREKIISSFFKLRVFSSLIVFLIFIIYMFLNFKEGLLLSICIASSFLDVFEFYNQGKLRIVYNSRSKSFVYLLGLILKIITIFYFKNYKLILFIYSVEFLFSYLLIYKYSHLNIKKLFTEKIEIKYLRSIFKKCISLFAASIFTILVDRLDILIIQNKFGFTTLGQYNLFAQIILLWSLIPTMLCNYHMPRLAKSYAMSIKSYKFQLKKYSKIYFLLGLILTLGSILIFNVQYLIFNYSDQNIYIACTILCFIHIPLTLSLLQASIVSINNLYFYVLIKKILSFFVMLSISLWLSDYLGIIGLPIGINVSYVFSELIFPRFFKNNIRLSLLF